MRKIWKGNSLYESPDLLMESFAPEAGFNLSGDDELGLPGEKPEFNDYGDF